MRRGLRSLAALAAATAAMAVVYAGVGELAPANACAQGGPIPTPTIPTIGPLDPTCARIPDTDQDGVLDVEDNCHRLFNATQLDTDKDSGPPPYEPVPVTFRDPKTGGDACDIDDDADTVPDIKDNCPKQGNGDQADADGDGIGDVCDTPGAVAAEPPELTIRRLARSYRADELRAGLAVPVGCSAACALSGTVAARGAVLGRGSGGLSGAGSTFVFVRVGKAARGRIARAGRLKAVVTVKASDDVGHAVTRTRRVTLRR